MIRCSIFNSKPMLWLFLTLTEQINLENIAVQTAQSFHELFVAGESDEVIFGI